MSTAPSKRKALRDLRQATVFDSDFIACSSFAMHQERASDARERIRASACPRILGQAAGELAPSTLTKAEAAWYLRLSERQLDRLPIPRFRAGKRKVLFYLSDLDAHLSASRFVPAHELPVKSRTKLKPSSRFVGEQDRAWFAMKPSKNGIAGSPKPRSPSFPCGGGGDRRQKPHT